MGGLKDLVTIFKDLKYPINAKGGGGPYITSTIPENDSLLNGTGGPDFLLRGGYLLPSKVNNDILRISKFLISAPGGVNFIGKQNLLSRIGVKTETSIGPAYGGGPFNEGMYIPINTISQIPNNPIGIHLNKNGLDIGGFYSPLTVGNYFNIVRDKNNLNNNRLSILFEQIINRKNIEPVLFEYDGGPGSIIGIGNTTIKRYIKTGINAVSYNNELIDFNIYQKGFKSYITNSNTFPEGSGKKYPFNTSQILKAGASSTYSQLKGITIEPSSYPSVFKSGSLDVDEQNIQSTQKSWRNITETENQGSTENIYLRKWGNEDWKENNDIIDFYFTLINNDDTQNNEILYFPCYIDNLSDNLSSLWSSEKYLGRGEDFWVYNGFDRNISFGFKVYARNKDLIYTMYNNLNRLSSTLLPDYNNAGFMRGNIIKLTIGKYIENLPGIITNLSYNVPMEHSWDTDIEIQLPFFIEVNTFSFKPIHNFLPRKGENLIARSL